MLTFNLSLDILEEGHGRPLPDLLPLLPQLLPHLQSDQGQLQTQLLHLFAHLLEQLTPLLERRELVEGVGVLGGPPVERVLFRAAAPSPFFI